MPFPDELTPEGVHVHPYQPHWPDEFNAMGNILSEILGPLVIAIDHVGSTSIPGMAAKDCIDIQVQVESVTNPELEHRMTTHGFRQRPEAWNRHETSFGETTEKRVYAPAAGTRPTNIHIRSANGPGVRYALLFRDYLRNNPALRDAWAAFKLRLAQTATDIYDYGQIKQPATTILMEAAQSWAEQTHWSPSAS